MARPAVTSVLLPLAALLVGCGGKQSAQTTAAISTTAADYATVWLCFPGKAPDPCTASLDTTAVDAHGRMTVERVKPAADPPIDCFYVYPTVSSEPTGNADLTIGLAETLVAQAQASQFSQACRVYAPMYRQITNAGLEQPALHASPVEAYGDVLAAWRDYLAHDNHGRGVVLIGHSQGAYALKHLVKTVIDPSPSERRLLVSAILLGGQVLGANGSRPTGDFVHIPPCASTAATGCVVAYSTFDRTPPPNARFGRTPKPGAHVLCVNPGAPGGGASPLTPLFPVVVARLIGAGLSVSPQTPWVSFPGLYTGRCERVGTASWLQIDHTRISGDHRPLVRDLLGATWGLHLTDVNIALGELVGLVRSEARAYTQR